MSAPLKASIALVIKDLGAHCVAEKDFVGLAPYLAGMGQGLPAAVFEDRADPKPSYMMWLEWRDGRISFICDYRHVRYVAADAELVPDAKPAGDGTAH